MPRLKDIFASFLMLERRCTRHSRHGSRHHNIRFLLSWLPTPRQYSPPLRADSATSFKPRPSLLSPKRCHLLHPFHPLPLKLHNNSWSRSPHASWRSCICSRKGPPTRRLPIAWWSRAPPPRNTSPVS